MELEVSHVQNLSSLTPIVDNIFDKYNKKFGTHKIFFQIMTYITLAYTYLFIIDTLTFQQGANQPWSKPLPR